MPLHLQVHEWLDDWEQAREHDGAICLEGFIGQVCGQAPAELVEEFHRAVRALDWMDVLLHRFGATGPPKKA